MYTKLGVLVKVNRLLIRKIPYTVGLSVTSKYINKWLKILTRIASLGHPVLKDAVNDNIRSIVSKKKVGIFETRDRVYTNDFNVWLNVPLYV